MKASKRGLPEPEPGLVVRYAYLWRDEFLAGREEGLKDRPCALMAAVRIENGETLVLVLPVTHTRPHNDELAIEIPANIKRHIGLDDELSWIMLNESNEFLWPGPDLRRVGNGDNSTVVYGILPPRFFSNVLERLEQLKKASRISRVRRTE